MPYVVPKGKSFRGRPLSDLNRDLVLIQELQRLMPMLEIRERVTQYMVEQHARGLEEAFGGAKTIREVVQRFAPDESEDILDSVDAEISQLALNRGAADDLQFLSDETEHAAAELVKSWLDLLVEVLDISELDRITLDDQLRPQVPLNLDLSTQKEWRDASRTINETLGANVALSGDDRAQIQTLFATALLSHPEFRTNKKRLLPHEMCLFREPDGTLVVESTFEG